MSFVKIYHFFVPKSYRVYLHDLFVEDLLYFLRNWSVYWESIKSKYFKSKLLKFKNELDIIRKVGPTPYCWNFRNEYKKRDITINFDDKAKLNYFDLEGKKLFLPVEYSRRKLQKLVWSLLIEQDIRSPHRYVQSAEELKDMVLMDVGAAEGIFSLMVIEHVKKVYLFEFNPIWIRSLEATFAPYTDKVVIVPSKVGNPAEDQTISLAPFISENQSDQIFIKLDIEGDEINALNSIKTLLLDNENIQLAVCTYHRPSDFDNISKILRSINYSVYSTDKTLYFNGSFNKVLIKSRKNL